VTLREVDNMHKGNSVQLVPLREEFRGTLFEWINERDEVLFNSAYRPVHRSQHDKWFDAIQGRADVVIFGIVMRTSGELIGSCQLHNISQVHLSAELQIRIGSVQARGKGHGREALGLLLDFGFRDLNLHRIYLHVLAGNERALALYRNLGFSVEGRLREAVFIDGTRQDVIAMGILRSEHAARR
jgi:RimJ/RimL family protein N-acetyltransferase